MQPYALDPSIPEMQFNNGEQYENIQAVNSPVESLQYNNMQYENPQYENMQYENVQYQYENQQQAVYQNNQPRLFGQRFKILNENNNSINQRTPVMEKLQAATV